MRKLNYANRRSEGLKLGQIVAKDLRKRAVTHTLKTSEPSPLEINLHGKSLTDKGLEEVAIALQEVLAPQPNGLPLYELEDLNLSDNGLTWKSFTHLARVIRLASRSLRELDLSRNAIKVRYNVESEAWEEFLDSFRECSFLAKLDLSRNELVGARPFEILARVFVRHARHDVARTATSEITGAPPLKILENQGNSFTKGVKDLRIDEKLDLPSMFEDDAGRYGVNSIAKIIGLRTAGSIIFSDCGMSYAGALFLSSAYFQYRPLEHAKRHRRRSSSVTAATQSEHSHLEHKGMIYLPNRSLPPAARSLLESAAVVAKEQSEVELECKHESTGQDENIPQAVLDTEKMHAHSYGSARRLRSSTFSCGLGHSQDLPEFKASAKIRLESYCKKAERSTIEELGPNSIQLWSSALKMLSCIRSLCKFDSNQKPELAQGAGSPSPLSGATLVEREYDDDAVIQSLSTSRPPPQMLASTLGKSITPSPVRHAAYAGAAAFSIDFPKRQTAKPAIRSQSLLLPSPQSNKSDNPYRNDVDSTSTTNTNIANTATTTATKASPHHHASKQDGLYPWHTHLPGLTHGQIQVPLPQHIWRHIVALAIGGPSDTLSEAQMNKVFAWAVDRSTLGIELDRLGKSESAQIWMVLDVMGCLAYEV